MGKGKQGDEGMSKDLSVGEGRGKAEHGGSKMMRGEIKGKSKGLSLGEARGKRDYVYGIEGKERDCV